MSDRQQFQTLAAQLRDAQDFAKVNSDAVLERAEGEGFDAAGLRRFVAWKRRDETKRAQQEAIDQQCRYLAGERDTPAELPIGCELAQAVNLFRRNFTLRQVMDEMGVSLGKASKLKSLSRMFDVHVHASVNTAALPAHDPATGEVLDLAQNEVQPPAEGIGHNSKRACILPSADAWKEITLARDEHEARKEAERLAASERRRLEREERAAFNARVEADTLEIPAHLRRTKQPPHDGEMKLSSRAGAAP